MPDTLVGKLLDAFDKSAYRDNTIVVFWSDHGYHFGEKDHFAKNTLWERSTHVPFIFVAPGLTKPSTRCDQPVDLTCLFPTLTSICGLPVPEGLDGFNVTSLLRAPRFAMENIRRSLILCRATPPCGQNIGDTFGMRKAGTARSSTTCNPIPMNGTT